MLIDTDKVVCLSEIAELACVTPSAVSNWQKRLSTFPAPLVTLRTGALYDVEEVTAWLADRDSLSVDRARRQIQIAERRIARLKRRLGE